MRNDKQVLKIVRRVLRNTKHGRLVWPSAWVPGQRRVLLCWRARNSAVTSFFYWTFLMFISWMLIMPSFQKSLILEQFPCNYLNSLGLLVFIRWIVIYRMDNAIHLLNNWGLIYSKSFTIFALLTLKSFCKVLNCTVLFQRALLLGRM